MICMAYPGCGKTYATELLNSQGVSALDYDSKNVTDKEDGWEKEYVDDIVELTQKGDYKVIFVSFNLNVIKEMVQHGIRFTCVIPQPDDPVVKEMMIGRYCLRTPDALNYTRRIKRQIRHYDERLDRRKITEMLSDNPLKEITASAPYILSVLDLSSLTEPV